LFRAYYYLTKPGIIYGNAITVVAGFLLASKGNINFILLLETLIGISLVIASACVINNVLDKDIDKYMERTKGRALVVNKISTKYALIYGIILGLIGFLLLYLSVNILVSIIGLIAYVDYIIFYGISKRASIHGTLVGTIAGAAPITAGYVAVSGHIDTAAIILFLILVVWQMPHFYAIAVYRLNDYRTAKLPVFPVIKGIKKTKKQILIYIVAFIVVTSSLRLLSYVGNIYLIVMLIMGAGWLYLSIKSYGTAGHEWARKLFFYSLVTLIVFSVLISINNLIS
jgi:protoheme IX farnesyltransferase